MEPPIIEEKETGTFKKIELSEELTDPERMFKHFEDIILDGEMTETSSRSDTQSVSNVDQSVTDSGEADAGCETSPDKSCSVDKTGQNDILSTVTETEEGNLEVASPPESRHPATSALLEDVPAILERVVDTQSSPQTPGTTSGHANSEVDTIANEENNIDDHDEMNEHTSDNISLSKNGEQQRSEDSPPDYLDTQLPSVIIENPPSVIFAHEFHEALKSSDFEL